MKRESQHWLKPHGARRLHLFWNGRGVSACRWYTAEDVAWEHHNVSKLCKTCERRAL